MRFPDINASQLQFFKCAGDRRGSNSNQILLWGRNTIFSQPAFALSGDWCGFLSKLLSEYQRIPQRVSIRELILSRVYMTFVVPNYRFPLGPIHQQENCSMSAVARALIITSVITVSFLSKHCSGPGCSRQPEGPHSCLATFLHSVSGEYLSTVWVSWVHTSRGHLVHFCSVVYP